MMTDDLARELWLASLEIAQRRVAALEAELSDHMRKQEDTYKVLSQLEAARGEHKGLLNERYLH